MSDRTSAELFGTIFRLLAVNPTEEHKAMARLIWAKRGDYDFSDYQVYEEDARVALGISRVVEDDSGAEEFQSLQPDGSWE